LKNRSLVGTPFNGGFRPLRAEPEAMTDGQTLQVMQNVAGYCREKIAHERNGWFVML